ncbi:histidine kinase [Streptomyces viridosporus]|uniref:histidine kinase n=1 Tax=Streptomyces viridosporus TaxID=67581 RepID=UPI0033331F01
MAWNAKVMFFRFPDPARTYQAFSEVKQLPSVGRAAILERAEDGTLSVPESYEPGAGRTTAVGGVVGALVGVLGGPMGIFLGWGAGTLVGMASDAEDEAESVDALTVLSRGVDEGSNVLVAGAEEDDPGPADAIAERLGGTIVRVPAGEVEAEVRSAQKAAEEAVAQARRQHRAERRQELSDKLGTLFHR